MCLLTCGVCIIVWFVNIFFNISCAGTAPEGRGRPGDIKKGLLYWFITTVAQQCTSPVAGVPPKWASNRVAR